MAKTVLKVFIAILAIIFGIGLYTLWNQLRPYDPSNIKLGVGVVSALAAFLCLYFMTKAGASGD